jgi:hypothetical protein
VRVLEIARERLASRFPNRHQRRRRVAIFSARARDDVLLARARVVRDNHRPSLASRAREGRASRRARLDVSFVAAFHERSSAAFRDERRPARASTPRVDARARARRRARLARVTARVGGDARTREAIATAMMARTAARRSTARVARGATRATNARRQARAIARRRVAVTRASEASDDAMRDEASGYEKRAAESAAAGVEEKRPPRGGDAPAPGSWSWTLNWDHVMFDKRGRVIEEPTKEDMARARVLIGSCPRNAEDVDRLVDEAGVEAIVCLQCSLCHAAMEIDWQSVRRRAIERGVMIVQVNVRDFDRLDQAKMLPEAVRKLAAFQAMGKRTYVHCTAGINRASLTVVGYLTFVKMFDLEAALHAVRTSRPQANPYVVSWEIARARLLAHRLEDIYLYSQVDAGGNTIDDGGDWIKRDLERAEKGVIAEVFKRAIDTDLSMYGALIEGDYQQQRH